MNEAELLSRQEYGFRDDKTDLRQYPDRVPNPNPVFTLGDIHGNPIKLIHLFVKYGVIDLPKDSYDELVRLYDRQVLFSRLHREQMMGENRDSTTTFSIDQKAIAKRRAEIEALKSPLDAELKAVNAKITEVKKTSGYGDNPEFKRLNKERLEISKKIDPLQTELHRLPKPLPEGYDVQTSYDEVIRVLEGAIDYMESDQYQPANETSRAEDQQDLTRWRQLLVGIKQVKNKQGPLSYSDILLFDDATDHVKQAALLPPKNRNNAIDELNNIKVYQARFRIDARKKEYTELREVMREELRTFKQIVADNAKVTPGCHVENGGDMTGDRGANDASVVGAIRVLKDNGLRMDVDLSDHDIHLIEYAETGDETAMRNFDSQHPGQANSGVMLIEAVNHGIVDIEEFREDYNAVYQGSLKAVGYSLSADRKDITLNSHAPIDWEVVEAMAGVLGVPYRDDTPLHKAHSIDLINRAFQTEYVQKKRVHELNHPPEQFLSLPPEHLSQIKREFPFFLSMWHRESIPGLLLNRPATDEKGYGQFFTHGHDEGSVKAPNIFNQDRQLGKPKMDVGWTSVTCTARDMALNPEEAMAMKQVFNQIPNPELLVDLFKKEETLLQDLEMLDDMKMDREYLSQYQQDFAEVSKTGDLKVLKRIINTAEIVSRTSNSGGKKYFHESVQSAACIIQGSKSRSQIQLDTLHGIVSKASKANNHVFSSALAEIPTKSNGAGAYQVANSKIVDQTKRSVVRELNKAAATTGLAKVVAGITSQFAKLGEKMKLGSSEESVKKFQSLKSNLEAIRELRSEVKKKPEVTPRTPKLS